MGRYSTRKQVDSHSLSDLIELPGGAFKMGSQQFYRCPCVSCQKVTWAAQVVRAETVALKGPMLPEVSTARTWK